MQLSVSIHRQTLEVLSNDDEVIAQFLISSALNGINCQKNSGGTPIGLHQVRAKIGQGLPINSVFVARRPTKEIWSESLDAQYPNRDWILSRILWLSGLELGVNRLGQVDTMQRYIYIHGTPDSEPMGLPLSHGCIRMRNQDVIDLFNRIEVGTLVRIEP